MANYHFYCESTLRGYHAYKHTKLTLGQILICEPEPDNEHDEFAIIVKTKDEDIAGHLPMDISEIVFNFLTDGGDAEAEVIGSRFNAGLGKGLEVPLDLKFIGSKFYVRRLRRELINIYGRKMVTIVALD